MEEIDGHNVEEIEQTLKKKNDCGKPRLIISHTIKGHGVSFMEGFLFGITECPMKRNWNW